MKKQKSVSTIIDPRILTLIIKSLSFQDRMEMENRNRGKDRRWVKILAIAGFIMSAVLGYFAPAAIRYGMCLPFAALFMAGYAVIEKWQKRCDSQWESLLSFYGESFKKSLGLELRGGKVEDMVAKVMFDLNELADKIVSAEATLDEKKVEYQKHLVETAEIRRLRQDFVGQIDYITCSMVGAIARDKERVTELRSKFREIVDSTKKLLGHYSGFNPGMYGRIFTAAEERYAEKMKEQRERIIVTVEEVRRRMSS